MKVISRRGVRLEKQFSSLENPIYTIDNPDEIFIPVLNGESHELDVKYKVGDYVQQYAEIVRDKNGFSVFAPYCGTFMGIFDMRHEILGNRPFIKFKSKPGLAGSPFKPVETEHLTGDEIIAISRRSGIVDELDNVPLYQKLEKYQAEGVHILICDAIEDEVYSTSAFARMIEFGDEAAKGLQLAARACGALSMKLAVSSIRGFGGSIADSYEDIQTLRVKGKYPVRYELCTSKRKKIRTIGVGACIELFNAAAQGRCHTTCIVTVDGECVKRPANLCVPIGTPISELFDICKLADRPDFYIIGDIMTGRAVTSTDIPVTADMTCILAVKAKTTVKKDLCIHCGSCAHSCPVGLMPYRISQALNSDNYKELSFLQVSDCIGCGACSFVCPCGIDVARDVANAKEKNAVYLESVQHIREEKKAFDKQIAELRHKEKSAPDSEKQNIKSQLDEMKKKEKLELDNEHSLMMEDFAAIDAAFDQRDMEINQSVDAAEQYRSENMPVVERLSIDEQPEEADIPVETEESRNGAYLYTPERNDGIDALEQSIEDVDVVRTVSIEQHSDSEREDIAEPSNEEDSITEPSGLESQHEKDDDRRDTDDYSSDTGMLNIDFDDSRLLIQMNEVSADLISEEVENKSQLVDIQGDSFAVSEESDQDVLSASAQDRQASSKMKKWFGGIFSKRVSEAYDEQAQVSDEDVTSYTPQEEEAVQSVDLFSDEANVDDSAVKANANTDIDYAEFDFSSISGIDYDVNHDLDTVVQTDPMADSEDLQDQANSLYNIDYSTDAQADDYSWLSFSAQETEYSSLINKSGDKDVASTSDILEEQYLRDMEKIDQFINFDTEMSDLEIDFDSIVKTAFDELDSFDSYKKGDGK